jgi:hypothetical protein
MANCELPNIGDPEVIAQKYSDSHSSAWEGAFAPENLTNEALGFDPTSGDPTRISKSALFEGFPNTTYASRDAAWFMIQQVRKYPGEVSIYSAGALTNIALAIRMDPDFAKNAKELVVMVRYSYIGDTYGYSNIVIRVVTLMAIFCKSLAVSCRLTGTRT